MKTNKPLPKLVSEYLIKNVILRVKRIKCVIFASVNYKME